MSAALTLEPLELRCPACHQPVVSQRIATMPNRVRRATDFRDVYANAAPVYEHLVHLCAYCGFAGDEALYGSMAEDPVNFALAAFLYDTLAWNLPWAQHSAVERTYHAVRVLELLEEPPFQVARMAMQGAWCAEAAHDHESERWFRREAAHHLATALSEFDGVPKADRPWMTYLMGELWRRLGDPELATMWFQHVPQELAHMDDAEQRTLVLRVAEQQLHTPQAWFP